MIKLALIALASSLAMQTQPLPSGHPPVKPEVPANHPAMPMPQGHPDISMPSDHPQVSEVPKHEAPKAPKADPDDVKSIEAIIKSYYATLSGPRGEKRNWDRLRSLMLPHAHFVTGRMVEDTAMPVAFTVEEFIVMNTTYFEKGGYFEDEIKQHVDRFGNIAQVFSTYESRRDRSESQAYSRGINSIQLIFDGKRWWIASILWDYERVDGPHANPIPEAFK